jgi:hypothetical protein
MQQNMFVICRKKKGISESELIALKFQAASLLPFGYECILHETIMNLWYEPLAFSKCMTKSQH